MICVRKTHKKNGTKMHGCVDMRFRNHVLKLSLLLFQPLSHATPVTKYSNKYIYRYTRHIYIKKKNQNKTKETLVAMGARTSNLRLSLSILNNRTTEPTPLL